MKVEPSGLVDRLGVGVRSRGIRVTPELALPLTKVGRMARRSFGGCQEFSLTCCICDAHWTYEWKR